MKFLGKKIQFYGILKTETGYLILVRNIKKSGWAMPKAALEAVYLETTKRDDVVDGFIVSNHGCRIFDTKDNIIYCGN